MSSAHHLYFARVFVLNSMVMKKENMACMGHQRSNKVKNGFLCCLTAIYGHQNQLEKYKGEQSLKNKMCYSGNAHEWTISPVKRAVVDVQIANRNNVLESCKLGNMFGLLLLESIPCTLMQVGTISN